MQPPKWIFDALPGAVPLDPPPVGYHWWIAWPNPAPPTLPHARFDIGLGFTLDGCAQVDVAEHATWAGAICMELHRAHRYFRDALAALSDETDHIPTSHQLRAAGLVEVYARRLNALAQLLRKCP